MSTCCITFLLGLGQPENKGNRPGSAVATHKRNAQEQRLQMITAKAQVLSTDKRREGSRIVKRDNVGKDTRCLLGGLLAESTNRCAI